jgi:hypothetical protein
VIPESGFYLTPRELREVTIKMLVVLAPYRTLTFDHAPPGSRYRHIILYGIQAATEGGPPWCGVWVPRPVSARCAVVGLPRACGQVPPCG